jgi:hypothetical protein
MLQEITLNMSLFVSIRCKSINVRLIAPFNSQKPAIDHWPWPSSQFNKWHAHNKLLSSSLIFFGAANNPIKKN